MQHHIWQECPLSQVLTCMEVMDDHLCSLQQYCRKSHGICRLETITWCKQRFRDTRHQKDNEDIHKIMHGIITTMNSFKLPANDNLYCLNMGNEVSAEVRDDLINCVTIGQAWCEEFKEECLTDEDHLQKPIPRWTLKTFPSDAIKSKVKSHDHKKKSWNKLAVEIFWDDCCTLMPYQI